MKGTTLLLFATILTVSGLAHAENLALEVGQTKVITTPRKFDVSSWDSKVVEVRRVHSGFAIEGKATGKSSMKLRTLDGVEMDFTVHVTSAGASVMEVGGQQKK